MVRDMMKNDVPELWRQRAKAGLCPVCGKDKSEFQKNMRVYCTTKCRDEYASKYTHWSDVRDKILKRDKKTCTICGDNREKFQRIQKEKEQENYLNWIKNNKKTIEEWRDKALVELDEWFQAQYDELMVDLKITKKMMPYDMQKKLDVYKHPFELEVDHIEAVALGGDMWDESNLRTLCKKCHKKKTAEDMKKMSIERLKEGNQTLTLIQDKKEVDKSE